MRFLVFFKINQKASQQLIWDALYIQFCFTYAKHRDMARIHLTVYILGGFDAYFAQAEFVK